MTTDDFFAFFDVSSFCLVPPAPVANCRPLSNALVSTSSDTIAFGPASNSNNSLLLEQASILEGFGHQTLPADYLSLSSMLQLSPMTTASDGISNPPFSFDVPATDEIGDALQQQRRNQSNDQFDFATALRPSAGAVHQIPSSAFDQHDFAWLLQQTVSPHQLCLTPQQQQQQQQQQAPSKQFGDVIDPFSDVVMDEEEEVEAAGVSSPCSAAIVPVFTPAASSTVPSTPGSSSSVNSSVNSNASDVDIDSNNELDSDDDDYSPQSSSSSSSSKKPRRMLRRHDTASAAGKKRAPVVGTRSRSIPPKTLSGTAEHPTQMMADTAFNDDQKRRAAEIVKEVRDGGGASREKVLSDIYNVLQRHTLHIAERIIVAGREQRDGTWAATFSSFRERCSRLQGSLYAGGHGLSVVSFLLSQSNRPITSEMAELILACARPPSHRPSAKETYQDMHRFVGHQQPTMDHVKRAWMAVLPKQYLTDFRDIRDHLTGGLKKDC